MAHTIMKGAFSFRLVNFPIRILTAKDEPNKDISFKNLHAGCQGQVGKKDYCKTCNVDVTTADIEKGYEVEKGKFVRFTKDEIDATKPDDDKILSIQEVVNIDQLDIARVEKTYLLAPEGPSAGEPFALMRESLRGKAAIGTFVMSGREHIAAVRPAGNGLQLHTLAYDYQMRSLEDVGYIPSEIDKESLKLGEMLVGLAKKDELDLSTYEDTRHQAVSELIKNRIAGGKITPIAAKKAKTATSGLLEQLQASLAAMNPATEVKDTKKRKKVA